MNLYLYIPPSSAHPPSCFKGHITGELKRYWLQNDPMNFQKMLIKFIDRLIKRGHKIEDLTPLLMQAAANLDNPNHLPNNKTDEDTLYIHWEFHPQGIQRSDIRRLYEKTLKPFLPYKDMKIAISRPSNLKDMLTRAKLTTPQNICINTLIAEIH